jgi:hypothetical protein
MSTRPVSWVCPHCASPDLEVAWSERRISPIDQLTDGVPWPLQGPDDEVLDSPYDLECACRACGAQNIKPLRAQLVQEGKEHGGRGRL